jgi:phenylalanine-4-hydroxylase
MKSPEGMKVYGSGLLSSFGEMEHAIESPHVQRAPLELEWAINQPFQIDRYQKLLFSVDSFDHLYALVEQLERWMKEGKLSHVAPGEPELKVADLESFLAVAQAFSLCSSTPALLTNPAS